MRTLSISSADAFILVYDVTDATTFDEARLIRDQIHETKGTSAVPIVVVGNKIDLLDVDSDLRQVKCISISVILEHIFRCIFVVFLFFFFSKIFSFLFTVENLPNIFLTLIFVVVVVFTIYYTFLNLVSINATSIIYQNVIAYIFLTILMVTFNITHQYITYYRHTYF